MYPLIEEHLRSHMHFRPSKSYRNIRCSFMSTSTFDCASFRKRYSSHTFADEADTTDLLQAQPREQAQPKPMGPHGSRSQDTSRGGQLVEMVQTMLATVTSSREAQAAPAGTRGLAQRGPSHPLMRQLDELHDLLLRASQELPGPETLADSYAEVRNAMGASLPFSVLPWQFWC